MAPSVIESNESVIPPEQRYHIEAAKRRRPDGTKQFVSLPFSDNDRLRSLAIDPWVDHAALDKLPLPISDGGRIKFLILGAGMGGIVQAITLIKQGFKADQIILAETAGGHSGTWYWNRYPGLHCDVESYCYLPYLEDTGYMPKQKYSSAVEIRTYLGDLVRRYGLENRISYRTKIKSLSWDESVKSWKVELTINRGPDGKEEANISIQADFVLMASGVFPYPQVPRVPGLADFEGQMFHTSRWNYDITGGSSDDTFPVMDKLKNLRVGIIGTGATAIQVVPQLAKYAKELFVFQRTPSQVNSRGQRDTDPTEWREKIASKPGWQKERMTNLAEHLAGHLSPNDVNLVDDVWSKLEAYCAIVGTNRFGTIAHEKVQEHIGNLLAADAAHTAGARHRVAKIVKDKETADALTAWYPTWCKRPTFSDNYLDSFNQDHVHLIDTNGKGIDSIKANSVVVNGKEFPVDVLILSTGFRTSASGGDPGSQTGVEITGRDGRSMSEKWVQEGMTTLHGLFTNGFPNLFFQHAGQAAATANYSHMIRVYCEHIAEIIATGHKRAAGTESSVVIEASTAAEQAWGMRVAQGAAFFSGVAICTPSYLTQEGDSLKMPPPEDQVAMMKKAKASIWQGGLVDYERVIQKWRTESDLEGVEITISA